MSNHHSSSNSSNHIRKSSKRRRIRPLRLSLVIAIGLGLLWGFLWTIIKFIILLWGILSQIQLFPSREPLEVPSNEETVVTESHESETNQTIEQNETETPRIELPPIIETTTFAIVPSGVQGNSQPYIYSELPSKKLYALKNRAQVGDLAKGVSFKTGVVVQLSEVNWIEAEYGNGVKFTYQLTNVSDQTQTFSQSIESSWQAHLFANNQFLKEQLSFYDETVTAIYPFQYLTQSFKNNYALGYQFEETERSCNDALTLEANQATTCSLVYDFVGTGTYDLLIHQGEESYQMPIVLEFKNENLSDPSSKED